MTTRQQTKFRKKLSKLFTGNLLFAIIVWSIFPHFQFISHHHIENGPGHNHGTQFEEKTEYRFSPVFMDEDSAELLHSHNKNTHTHFEKKSAINSESSGNNESVTGNVSDAQLSGYEISALVSLARGQYGLRPVGSLSIHGHVLKDINSDGQYLNLNKSNSIKHLSAAPSYFVSGYNKELTLPWSARAPPCFAISIQT